MATKSLVVGIAGPTGIGKTEVALRLAKMINGELISCDSVQIFKHLNIGANKFEPGPEDPPQHLVSLLEPTADFSAGEYLKICIESICGVISRKKVPILVGGTGFYFDWLINGFPSAPVVPDEMIAKVSDEVLKDNSWDLSIKRLQTVDSNYADAILRNDYYRLTKAIAFYEEYGYPLSSCKRIIHPLLSDANIDWRCVYLTADREKICRNIDKRCEQMIQEGLLQETFDLLQKGLLLKDSIAGRSIGYKESIDFFESISKPNSNHEQEFVHFLEQFAAATRQYSRKQDTWFANKFQDQFVWMERSEDLTDLVWNIYAFCSSVGDLSVWTLASAELKAKLRSEDEKDKRRKKMRVYQPTFSFYSCPDHINSLLSTLNK